MYGIYFLSLKIEKNICAYKNYLYKLPLVVFPNNKRPHFLTLWSAAPGPIKPMGNPPLWLCWNC